LRKGDFMSLPGCLALAAVVLAGSLPVVADEAADTFNKFYGEHLKRVAARAYSTARYANSHTGT